MNLKNPQTLQATLCAVFRDDDGYDASQTINSLKQDSPETYRQLLGDVLIASNVSWRQQTLNLIDAIWKEEAETRTNIPVQDVMKHPCAATVGSTKISVWKGDITKLEGKNLAIVNAANDQGLGCFVPQYRCIDNVIHREAGPRLRMECQKETNHRRTSLSTGTPPIVTAGYHLPSGHVIHATGPKVLKNNVDGLTSKDREDLKITYELVLETGSKTDGIGIRHWLEKHPESRLDQVVFNVFTNADWDLYPKHFPVFSTSAADITTTPSLRDRTIDLAKQWIEDADAVLICSGAGMSVKEGEMVYTNPDDFTRAYPWFLNGATRPATNVWGYQEIETFLQQPSGL
ncbi:unnamed protein product [Cylindrotheca closterium]|uniref:Macro domain-containing protein n=1 Tax=Cylindrotheca closterium TaxID=2856 RepID=A0AAD2CG15_9STRA|nr:unnamed protein product [Cylindrotheca closterium]